MTDDLARLRATVSRAMMRLLWAQLPLIAAAAWLSGHNPWPPCLAGAALATAASLQHRRMPQAEVSRATVGVALVGMASLILAACAGSPMQPDIHMYYFAILAMLAAYCDRTVILAAAAAIVLHHLVLNFIAPELVFPGGGNFPRVLLHGAIVALEAGTLIWLTGQVVIPFKAASRNLAAVAEANKAAQAAQAAAAASELARLTAERQREAEAFKFKMASEQKLVVDRVAAALRQLAAGDLLHRITDPFAQEYERLRTDFNAAVAQLLESMKLLVDYSGNIRHSARSLADGVADLTWRNALQRDALQTALQAVQAMTDAAQKTANIAARAQSVIAEAETDLRGMNAASDADGLKRLEERALTLDRLVAGITEAVREKQERLREVAAAMQEVKDITQEYAETITASNQAGQRLVADAEQLVNTVCDFNISEAAARAAWRPAAA